ncbi:MAG: peptidase M3 [Spirochaetales bacterium]|nr:peptidase M3 [Spirochaetales bacterium]
MQIPRWKLESIYPSFSSDKYRKDVDELKKSITAFLEAIHDSALQSDSVSWAARCIQAYNKADDLIGNLDSYAYAGFSTDTKNPDASKELNKLEEISLPLRNAVVIFRNQLEKIKDKIGDADFLRNLETRVGGSYGFFLREELEFQKKQMEPGLEDLASDLSRSGGSAWERLQEAVSSNLAVTWDENTGEQKTVIQLRSLAFSPDRNIRQKAFELELKAWKSVEIPIAFSINGVKGFAVSLNKRRRFSDSLEKPLMQSRISKATLDTLISAMTDSLPIFRRYLKAKAKFLQLDSLAFFDLFAPVRGAPVRGSPADEPSESWTYDRARDFICTQFDSFSRDIGDFARQAFKNGWIDAESREGKVGGAYCTSFPLSKESRILCNFEGSFSDLSTIAHELGHAYHHHVLRDETAIHRDYPMTLAETASIFSQTLVFNAALENADPGERIHVIEEFLQDATQVIVDILSRFYFEKRLFSERAVAEVSAEELCEFMVDAQKNTYGEGLDPEYLHPYMWAAKGHYYRQELAFYNYPYAFGLLFGLALFNRSTKEGESFEQVYHEILRNTGRGSANEVTANAGFNIESQSFWKSGLDEIARYVDIFVDLVGDL